MSNRTKEDEPVLMENVARPLSRRKFFGIMGAGSAVVLAAASCRKDHWHPGKGNGNGGVDLGSGDTGILNYAYALEQLEAAFYTQVIKTPFQRYKRYGNGLPEGHQGS